MIVGRGGAVERCNRIASEQLGAVVGRPLGELFDPTSRARLVRTLALGWTWATEHRYALAGGAPVELRARRVPGDGDRWLVQIASTTARDVLDEARDLRRRADTLADLAGAVARELNDPMSIVQGRLELLLELGISDPEAARRHLDVALEHARRISATLRNLRLVGRAPAPSAEPVALAAAVDEALELVGSRGADVVVVIQPPELATGGEPAMYARVFANLLRCALDRAPRSARVALSAHPDRDGVVVSIVTRGGLREPDEPPAGAFAVDRALLASAGARLEHDARPGESRIVLRLPPAPYRRGRALPAEDRLLVVGSGAFRRRVGALLADEGFERVEASHAEAALDALAEAPSPITRVLTELWLEGPSGLALARAVTEHWPDLRGRIVIAAHAPLDGLPGDAVSLVQPLGRRALLEALGRRVR